MAFLDIDIYKEKYRKEVQNIRRGLSDFNVPHLVYYTVKN